jgi:hypothetical protein
MIPGEGSVGYIEPASAMFKVCGGACSFSLTEDVIPVTCDGGGRGCVKEARDCGNGCRDCVKDSGTG